LPSGSLGWLALLGAAGLVLTLLTVWLQEGKTRKGERS